jgi:3'-5' exonuclease
VLRGVADKRREGSRRPSLADALREALGVELPKTSQLSPWWRDRLTDEQIAYAAMDAVMALRLATALRPRIEKLPSGPHALFRLCKAVMPVARMELAGIALAQQAAAWDQELVGLKGQIAKLGIENPSSSPQVSAWLRPQLKRLEEQSSFAWLSSWPRTPTSWHTIGLSLPGPPSRPAGPFFILGFRRAQVHPEASPFPPKAPSKTLAEAELVREAAPIREPPPLDRNPRWDATGSSSQATALRQINQSLRGGHKSR